jgi:hypothetical protein
MEQPAMPKHIIRLLIYVMAVALFNLGVIVYQGTVIQGQKKTIELMQQNPACTHAPEQQPEDDGGTHGPVSKWVI